MSDRYSRLQPGGGYGFTPEMTVVTPKFKFGPRDFYSLSLDQTLANLFDTLTIECSGVLVQPQWKHFRHIAMLKNDRIRLSNGIWRSWHLQFQKRQRPLYCQFDISPKLNHHKRLEAVVLEGKYWKRKESAVATEYRKWRLHYHKKNKNRPEDPYLAEVKMEAKAVFEELQRRSEQSIAPQSTPPFLPLSDLPDTLLNLMDTSPSLPDTTMGSGLQQPNLDMLNPMWDDLMNKLHVEPMDMLPARGSAAVPTQQPSVYPQYPQLEPFTQQHPNLSPTAFLNLPPQEQTTPRQSIELSQLSNFAMKPEPLSGGPSGQGSCLYSMSGYQQQQPQFTSPTEEMYSMQAILAGKVESLENSFTLGGQPMHSPHPTHDRFTLPSSIPSSNQYTAPGHMTASMDAPFLRVSSADSLTALASPLTSTRPPLERGKSEPIQKLREQVQKLSDENEKQLKEISRQQNYAEKQYSELLKTVMSQVGTGSASEQQKLALQSVLSDPAIVNILRDALVTTSLGGPGAVGGQGADYGAESKMALREMGGRTPDYSTPIVSPTDITKVAGVGDLQTSLLMSTGSQAIPNTGAYLSGGSDSEATPKLKPSRKLSCEEKEVYRELRRQSHITAEQKRRGSIKQGFDHLQSLVVNLSAYPSGKVSKAVILEKTVEHVQHCHSIREERERKTLALQREIEELNNSIARCQEMLPASGVPATRQRFEENRQRFREYIQRRTQQNYKFWIFSLILKQLFESYNSMVSTGSVDELCRTVLSWFEQNCALPALRPVVMASLRELSQKTSILTDPAQVPRQLAQYAQQEMQQHREELEHARTNRYQSFS